MKNRKFALILGMVLTVSCTLLGCGSKSDKKLEGPLVGEWAYIHDTETTAFEIKENGTAKLDGTSYDVSFDDKRITLTDKKGNAQSLLYVMNGDKNMFLYKISTYKYQGTDTPNGLIGVWIDTVNGNSSFEFTENGTFREDSYIPGYYTVNEAEGSILFVYNDMYEDTTIYYKLDGDILTVEYPWPMVKR